MFAELGPSPLKGPALARLPLHYTYKVNVSGKLYPKNTVCLQTRTSGEPLCTLLNLSVTCRRNVWNSCRPYDIHLTFVDIAMVFGPVNIVRAYGSHDLDVRLNVSPINCPKGCVLFVHDEKPAGSFNIG